MDTAVIKKWTIFFIGILCAILIANFLSNEIVAIANLTGTAGFIIGFVLYALFFFGVLYLIEKTTGIVFFRFSYD